MNYKVLMTKSSTDTLSNKPDAIYDPDSQLYFTDPNIKYEIQIGIGSYCRLC